MKTYEDGVDDAIDLLKTMNGCSFEYIIDRLEDFKYSEQNIIHQKCTELPPNMKTVTFDSNKYKLVPIEPTPEMIDAACQDGVNLGTKSVWKHTVDVQAKWKWKQMIDASPNIE